MERILLVDDDDVFRERLARAFEKRGYTVDSADGYAQALSLARMEPPARAVVDLNMPGRGGLQVVRDLHALVPDAAIVVLTGYGSVATAVDAVRLGACNYLHKPAHADMILAAFDHGAGDPLESEAPEYEPPSLARTEWEHIQRVLADCGGNVSMAARKLGLHRRTLQRKLNKYAPND